MAVGGVCAAVTLATAIVWSAVRSLAIAVLAVWPATVLTQRLQWTRSPRERSLWIALAVAPCFVPELLLGFTWRLTAVKLVQQPAATELLYAILLLSRAIGIAVAVRLFLPSNTGHAAALHAWQLLKPVSPAWSWWRTWIRLRLEGPWRAPLVGGSLSALVCFQEFETAALLQIDRLPVAWTVSLFDAHAARQPLEDSLRMLLWPVTLEWLLLAPCWLLFRRPQQIEASGNAQDPGPPRTQQQGRLTTVFAISCLTVSLGTCVIWPLIANLRPLLTGMAVLSQLQLVQQSLQQILVSLLFAAAAAIIALRSAVWLRRRHWPAVAALWLLPGLSGSLLIGIVLLTVFQWPILNRLYDTWLPLLLGLSLSVLPRAWLAVSLLERLQDHAAVHAALLLQTSGTADVRRAAGRITWRLQSARWFMAGLVICHWCFWDVTVTSILRPLRLEPVITRLYNEMHYGRTEALTLITVMAALATPACGLLAAVLWRVVHHRRAS